MALINRVTAESGSRIVQESVYDAEASLFIKMSNVEVATNEELESVLMQYCTAFSRSSSQVEQSRLKAADVVVALGPLARKGRRLRDFFTEQVARLLTQERSVLVRRRLELGMKSVDV